VTDPDVIKVVTAFDRGLNQYILGL